ncbi:hypothetical protein HJG60_009095 [Phyllostomus discolor]|uniref:Uncharacterized protein n=1 Tax=Phyllostomus discolor TaxID=89673 RepID=A0A834DF01_9CHIR|nr:hypothetical protein HJG60_009095 [Phyllostomus discolor]
MPQKPRGENIFKSMQWMDPGFKSHSDQHVPMGLDTGTRQASDKRPQKPESEDGIKSKEMLRAGKLHLKLGRTGHHNGAGSERSGLANGKCWSPLWHSWAPQLISQSENTTLLTPKPSGLCVTVKTQINKKALAGVAE